MTQIILMSEDAKKKEMQSLLFQKEQDERVSVQKSKEIGKEVLERMLVPKRDIELLFGHQQALSIGELMKADPNLIRSLPISEMTKDRVISLLFLDFLIF